VDLASLLTVAVAVIVIVGNPQAGRSTASLQSWAAVAIVVGPLLVACVVAGQIRGGAIAAVLFVLVSGSLWGVFAVLTKEVVARLGDGGWAVIQTPPSGSSTHRTAARCFDVDLPVAAAGTVMPIQLWL
jgi:xanthine/uracil/vitamin C permease (AzgA family)